MLFSAVSIFMMNVSNKSFLSSFSKVMKSHQIRNTRNPQLTTMVLMSSVQMTQLMTMKHPERWYHNGQRVSENLIF